MSLLRLHVLPIPSPVRLSVPRGSAPSAPPSQLLQHHQIRTRSSKLSIIIPEVGRDTQTGYQHTQSRHPHSGQVSPAWPWSPHLCGVTSRQQGCGSNPAPSHPEFILPAPGLAAGHGATPQLWKSRFSLCPWEAARWRGEDGAFSFVELLQEQGRAAQPFGMCTGEVTIQCPQVKCLSLIPARWQEQGCSSHPGCSSAEGGVGSRAGRP